MWKQFHTRPSCVLRDIIAAFETFEKRGALLRAKNPDFDEVINRDVFTESLAVALYGIEQGPDIAYELGKNEVEATEIIKRLQAGRPS